MKPFGDKPKKYPPEVKNMAPEKLPGSKRKALSSNHHFSGGELLNFASVLYHHAGWFPTSFKVHFPGSELLYKVTK